MLSSASRCCLRRPCLDFPAPLAHVRRLTVGHIYNPRVNNPSNQVWKFKANPQAEQRNSRASKKTGYASLDVSSGGQTHYSRCLEASARMKLEGTRPDLHTYLKLMKTASEAGLWKHGWAILDDMLLVGVEPNVDFFNLLLHVRRGIRSKWLMTRQMTGAPSPSISLGVEDSR